MRNVIHYFVRYNLTGDLLMIAILVAGYVGLTNLRSNFFPEVESKTIQIQVVYPGASPEEIEEGIVAKIEENLQGIAGLDQVKSVCNENAGNITIEVLDAGETDEILQDVKNAVDRIASFPVGMEPPIVFKQDAVGVAFTFAVTGVDDLRILKQEARRIEQELRAVDGISQVLLSGFPDEEIEIRLREDRLAELNLTIAEVGNAIRSANIETTGGRLKTETEELIIRGRYREYYADELRDIVVRADREGRVVRLDDIAEVREQWAENDPSRNWFNGAPAAVVTINNLNSESILDITEYIRSYIEAYNARGGDTRIEVIRDSSVVLNQRIELLVNNGIVGFLLVVVFLALFLNIRLAFWVALAIPVSFAGMFLLAAQVGITINVISLFGMILVIGILVDDGIVIAENIYQHYERGSSRIEATIEGTLEVLPAVFSAIATTVVAFSAFFFIEGRLGDFFTDMAKVIILTLVFSLVEGALILPAHVGHSKALRRDFKPNAVERAMRNLMVTLRAKIYAPVLRFAMNQPWVMFSFLVAIFLISVPGLIGGGLVKTTFFPFIEGDNLTINLQMQAGTREQITKAQLDRIEAVIWEVDAELSGQRDDTLRMVQAVDKKLGPSTYAGIINVQLLDGERRGMQSTDISAMIRERVGPIYGAENLSFAAFSPFGRPVSVSLLGNDLNALEKATAELKEAMLEREDLKDVTDNNQKGMQEVEVELRPRARQLGLTELEVMSQIRQGFFGAEVQRLQRGRDEVRVWVRLDERDRASVGSLEDFRIRTITGALVPLTEVAEVNVTRGISAINRLYGQREVQVSADLAGPWVSATDANAEIRDNVVPSVLAQYPSVTASFEGQNRETAKSQNSISKVMPLIFALMLFIIILTFRSPLQGLAVFGLIPFGLIGVSVGHWVLGAQVSLFSILGMIALIGILVNDALVFVAAFNTNLKSGMAHREAIWEAGMSRFRPIILTSVTTVAGLAPLMLNKSFQAQFLIPMAISVAFGLLFVTVIILILLPIYLLWINPLHRSWVWVKKGDWLPADAAEPANREDAEIAKMAGSMTDKLTGNQLVWAALLLGAGLTTAGALQAQQADLSLQEAMGRAMQNNYGIQLAELRVDNAEVADSWGAVGALPMVGVGASLGSNVTDQTENPTSFLQERIEAQSVNTSLQASWTLFDGMGMFATKRNLELLVQQSAGEVDLVVEQTASAVALAYQTIILQDSLLESLEANLKLSQDRLAWVETRQATGAGSTYDRLQFEIAVANDESARVRQAQSRRNAMRNLNRLMGEAEDVQWTLTTPLAALPGFAERFQNTEEFMQSAAEDATNIRNARLVEQIAETGLDRAEARLYPTLGLNVNLGDVQSQFAAGDLSGAGRTKNQGATLTLNFNLFNGGATKRAIEQAKIQQDVAATASLNERAGFRQLLADALDRYATQEELYNLAKTSAEKSRELLAVAEDRLAFGAMTSLDFRNLQNAYLQARVRELQELQAWNAAHWEVMRLTGALRAPISGE